MKKEQKYVVIGGQYEQYCYGTTATLLGAKRLARRNQEYWDNWAGWHTPAIYRLEDCEYADGDWRTDCNATPVAAYSDGEWSDTRMDREAARYM